MRTELVKDKWLLCGVILPYIAIQPNQTWAAADGSGYCVQVMAVSENWVTYSWIQKGELKSHRKDPFAFQCRYCLTLPTAEIPQNLINLVNSKA